MCERSEGGESREGMRAARNNGSNNPGMALGVWARGRTLVSRNSRLKDLLGPVTGVKQNNFLGADSTPLGADLRLSLVLI